MRKLINRRDFFRIGLYGGLSTLMLSYPLAMRKYLYQINTYRIPVKNLPKEFNGFTIAHLTDLHFGFLMPLTAVRAVLNTTNLLDKDITVCTGDYIHERNGTKQIDIIWPELAKLKAKGGVYSVLGNHDHWADSDKSLYWLKKSGQDLRHKAKSFTRGNQRIWLGGVGDLWEDDLKIDETFKDIPENECKIMIAHNPESADTDYKTRIDLIISGHTHGGQFRLPVFRPPMLPVKNKKYTSGLIKSNNTSVYISRGIGWAVLPIRFNCSPEISVLKLVQAV